MSSPYVAGTAWVPTSGIDLVDDGDPAAVAGLVATDEAALDRTEQFTRPKLVALGSVPYVSNAARFATDFNYMSVTTVTAAGDEYRCTLPLVQGATIASIDVVFVPKTTARGGWPLGTAPVISLVRSAIGPSGGVPAAPASVATATYVPVSQADYQNGNFKVMTVSPAHVVDAEAYVYQLSVVDEAGANAIPGGTYCAYRVNYA